MYCPRCGSKRIVAEERGFSWRNGLIGSLIFGDHGFLAGFLGSSDIVCECMNCGYEWTEVD